MSSLETTPKEKAQETFQRSGASPIAHVDDSFLRLTTRAGFAAAGSLGVRGFILDVRGAHHEDRVQALREALQSLREQGVRRVHTILDPGDTLEMAARDVGFGPCPGETLFQREVACPPTATRSLPESFTLRDGTLEDLLKISNELTHVPELAFHGWEKLLIGRELARSDRFFKVIEHEGSIVGISVGGSHGERGTISHTWVAPEHRNHRLGRALSDSSLSALYEGGARVVHLMTTPGNDSAERFWERQGFSRKHTTFFLELDI
jgi:ribosomal protein S18 acetylase RimI-like enzyme